MNFRAEALIGLFLLLLLSCATHSSYDCSIDAVEAGDKTLIVSACSSSLAGGFDVCRITEGSPQTQSMVFVVPWTSRSEEGVLRIRYQERSLDFPIRSSTVTVPWSAITGGAKVWKREHESPVQVIARIRYKTAEGPSWTDMLGYVVPVVLKAGYKPLPLGGSEAFFSTECSVAYSTAGRSSVQCRK